MADFEFKSNVYFCKDLLPTPCCYGLDVTLIVAFRGTCETLSDRVGKRRKSSGRERLLQSRKFWQWLSTILWLHYFDLCSWLVTTTLELQNVPSCHSNSAFKRQTVLGLAKLVRHNFMYSYVSILTLYNENIWHSCLASTLITSHYTNLLVLPWDGKNNGIKVL